MPQQTKTFRVFVSSTFDDLKAERNVLQDKVFPELQKLCETNGCRFQAIDLRWGVSEEAALDQQTMNICMTELKRCQDISPRPNFIILLGDRYGWIPLPPQIEAVEFEMILSQVNPEDHKLLVWDEAQPGGGGGWYRLDTNAVPPEYVLRPRRDEVFAEADYASWSKTEEQMRSILRSAINSLGWPESDQRRIKYECSATHQEIIEGALKLPDEREHVFAFLRNIQNLDDMPPGSTCADAGVKKAHALKEMITQTKGVTSYSYDVICAGLPLITHLDQFAADTLSALRRIIEEEIRQLKQIDELTREKIAHEGFGKERCRHFIGRQKILDDIAAYIHAGQQFPLVVYGPSGSGKSALIAKAVSDAADKHKKAYIIQRFIGATPESMDIRTLLRNLCLEIYEAFGFDLLKEKDLDEIDANVYKFKMIVEKEPEIIEKIQQLPIFRYVVERIINFQNKGNREGNSRFHKILDLRDRILNSISKNSNDLHNFFKDAITSKYEIPVEYKYLSERFNEFLRMISEDQRLLLFLDGLDQLSVKENTHSLNWLPSKLPPNVKIIVSVLEREDDAGECLRSARSNVPKSALLCLEDMPPGEGEKILQTWLLEAYPEKKRTLTEEQLEHVLDSFRGCPKPLYLKLAFEEARRWKSYEGLPRGAENIPGLALGVPGIVGDMLTRLRDKKQHGEVLVKTFLGIFSAARHGLSETEILELLSGDEEVMADLKARSARSLEANGIPAVVWLRLYHDLAPYLTETSVDQAVLFNFYHRLVGETIKLNYLHPEYHSKLARYFRHKADPTGDSTWSDNYVHSLSELPFQQTESGSMWDELESTLTELRFIEAKCKAGMGYDLISDYNHAELAWPGQKKKQRKEDERKRSVQVYVDKLIEHARHPKTNPIPDPPKLVKINNRKSSIYKQRGWSRLERVKAWGNFVSTHIRQLADGNEPVFQMAWNSADSGPVAERVADMEKEGKGISGEWLRLQNRSSFCPNHACLKVLAGHGATALSMTSDGERAVSGSSDGTLQVWNLATGKCMEVMGGHTDSVNAVSITPDGERAVSGSSDKTMRVWNLATGKCMKVMEGHTDSVNAVSITPAGERAVSGSWDKTLRVWNLTTGKCLKVMEGYEGEVVAVSITPDGARAVSGSWDGTLRVWDLATGECLKVMEGHEGEVNAVSITPDGRRAVSGSYDRTLRVWNLATGKCMEVMGGHTDSVNAVSITPTGERAVL